MSLQVTPTALMVPASPSDQKKITAFGNTVYYGPATVTSSSYTGTLTTGTSVKIQAPTWFVTARNAGGGIPGTARLEVLETILETAPENAPVLISAGAASDAAFDYTPPDGAQAVDSGTGTLYTRIAGVWMSAGGGVESASLDEEIARATAAEAALTADIAGAIGIQDYGVGSLPGARLTGYGKVFFSGTADPASLALEGDVWLG